MYKLLGSDTLADTGKEPKLSFRQQWLLALAPIVGIVVVGAVAWRLLRGGGGGKRREKPRPRPIVPFYERMLRVLRRRGFVKPEAQTSAEFADHVMGDLGPGLEAIGEITWRFYAVRFGPEQLPPDEALRLTRSLKSLDREIAQRLKTRRRR